MRYEERAKLAGVKALVLVAIVVSSPVLLVAGSPIRRRYLRHVYRDDGPSVLDKERDWVSAHYFVVTNPVLGWLCRPTEVLAPLLSRRGRSRSDLPL
ncbi:hypothetical protein [Streptomyces sp. NPDC096339]|uniref:hypothetical protein n=1 Tax=Streptomyces sp. NPDC096339 TaxID=3366086 RepID=UPI00382DC59C